MTQEENEQEFMVLADDVLKFGSSLARSEGRAYDVRHFAAALWRSRPMFGWLALLPEPVRTRMDDVFLEFMIAVQSGDKPKTAELLEEMTAVAASIGKDLAPIDICPLPDWAL